MNSMTSFVHHIRRPWLPAIAALVAVGACAQSTATTTSAPVAMSAAAAPSPDPRLNLKAGLYDAGEAAWNLKVVSKTPPSEKFKGGINSDLAFIGNYAIQGSFSGYQVWDISNPSAPTVKTSYYCPASQSDVSVYKNLLFVSGEDLTARIDCGAQGVPEAVSKDRLRGIRIFDITDIANPKNVGNVQTCRGSHTHTVLVDPKDPDNVYVYISGSAGVRSEQELPGCVNAPLDKDPNSALFRIEVIKVPVAHPEQAAIVSSPRIFTGLVKPLTHGDAPQDAAKYRVFLDSARKAGAFIAVEGWPGGFPYFASLMCSPETVRSFLKDVGRGVALNYDPSHLIRLRVDHIRFLKEFAEHVKHVHAKDTDVDADALYEFGTQPATFAKPHGFGEWTWRYTIPGQGVARWSEITSILKNSGYTGVVSVELEDEHFNGSEAGEKAALVHSLNYLKGM